MLQKKNPMIIHVDLDSVAADFEAGFLRRLREKHPDLPYIPLEDRTTFKLREQYVPKFGAHFREIIKEIETEPGFFRSLPPIPGSIEAIREIARKHLVYFCSAPLKETQHSAAEKYDWVEEQFGGIEWRKQLILTFDKTLIRGHILIDDKPEITGAVVSPYWEQVLVDWPYNRHVTDKRRINYDWSNWKEVLPELL